MAKGITKERIIRESEKLIEDTGVTHFSMHALAARLNIKTASLYSHISGMEEIMEASSMDILHQYHDYQMKSITGKTRNDALLSLAVSERKYAQEHPAFYDLIMNLQLSDNQKLKEEAACLIEPIMLVLDQYHLTKERKVDAERAFRSCVFGFISQEKHKYFSHLPNDTEESFLFSVNLIIHGIEAMEHAE